MTGKRDLPATSKNLIENNSEAASSVAEKIDAVRKRVDEEEVELGHEILEDVVGGALSQDEEVFFCDLITHTDSGHTESL